MTLEESIGLLAIIKLAYPNSYKDIDKDTQVATVNMWQRAFATLSYPVVELALDRFVKKSKFPPTIADMCEELKHIHGEALGNVLTLEPGSERDFYLGLMKHTQQIKDGQQITPNLKIGTRPLIEG